MTSYNYLPFVSDEILFREVKKVIESISTNNDNNYVFRNSIDPFSAIFEATYSKIDLAEWLSLDKVRQSQKTLQNAIGLFHQNILGSMDGWESLPIGGGIDVRNISQKIIGEIKNKYNTCNSKSSKEVFLELKEGIENNYVGFTAYHVQIIPKDKKEYNKTWNYKGNKNPKIKLIDGKTFYSIASRHNDALKRLYMVLPLVINKITNNNNNIINDSLFQNLFEKTYN